MKYHIERSTTIDASVKEVFKLVSDFNTWTKWSPWNIAEPDVPMTYEGEAGTEGHKMTWDGEIIGSGEQVLVSVSDTQLEYDLAFFKPFKSKAKAAFSLKEDGGKTTVTWTMDSSMPFFLFFMLPMMKAWIGMDYDRGLRMLKEVVENGSVNAKTENKGIQQFEGFSYVGIKKRAKISEMKQMSKDFEKIINDVVKKHEKSAKHWVALYPKFHAKTGEMTYIAAVSDEELKDVDLGSDYVRGEIKTGPALEIFHRGSYDFIGNAWSMGSMLMRAKKMKKGGVPFEYYHNSPFEVKEDELKTSVYFPVKQ